MKNRLFLLLWIGFSLPGFSQVGINTPTPDAQLHIKSSNQAAPASTDGIIIPKIDAFPLTDPAAAQQGMMVYLTTLSAGKPPGFYYWDNTGTPQWKGFGGSIPNGTAIGNTMYWDGTNWVNNSDFLYNDGTAIGVNTNAPTSVFTIKENGIGLSQESSTGNSQIGFYTNNGGAWLQTHTDTNLSFATDDGATQMVLTTAGNLGINTLSPSEKLEVDGKTKTTDLQVTNGAAIGMVLTSDAIGNAIWQNPTAPNAWSLTGNSGTNPAVNFIGTTDNKPIVFKAFNQVVGRIEPGILSDVFLGPDSGLAGGGYYNVGIGYQTLKDLTIGSHNVGIGLAALTANTEGHYNLALGANTLAANTTGINNTAIGYSAVQNNQTGNANTGIGHSALLNSKGNENTAIGFQAMYEDIVGNGATAIGTRAMQNILSLPNFYAGRNAALGFEALRGSTTPANNTGYDNTAVGYQSLLDNTTGWQNVAVGSAALWSNTTGRRNTANGYAALYKNTTGYSNTTTGHESLYSNTTGYANVAQGVHALNANTEGLYNTATGYYSLSANTTGSYNIADGTGALGGNKTGDLNTALGNQALNMNVSGSRNVAIGANAGYNETGSDKLYIENSGSATPLIYGEFNNDLARINGNFRVNSTSVTGEEMQVKNSNLFNHAADQNINFGAGDGYFMISSQDAAPSYDTGGVYGDGNAVTIWSPGDANGGQPQALVYFVDEDSWGDNNGNPYDSTALKSYINTAGALVQISDQNKKDNIVKIENALEKVTQVSGYSYQFKLAPAEIEKGDKPHKSAGVLAQELEKVLPEAVQKNQNGDYFVDYAAITPLLIEAIKEQNAKIKSLETTNAEILKRLEKLENN